MEQAMLGIIITLLIVTFNATWRFDEELLKFDQETQIPIKLKTKCA